MNSRWKRRGVQRQDEADGGDSGGDEQYAGDHVQGWETGQSQALAQQEAQEEEEARLVLIITVVY